MKATEHRAHSTPIEQQKGTFLSSHFSSREMESPHVHQRDKAHPVVPWSPKGTAIAREVGESPHFSSSGHRKRSWECTPEVWFQRRYLTKTKCDDLKTKSYAFSRSDSRLMRCFGGQGQPRTYMESQNQIFNICGWQNCFKAKIHLHYCSYPELHWPVR